MHDSAETSLALHDSVRDTHLPAESWEEDDELDRIDIIRDKDERSLLGLNERHNMVEPILDGIRLLADVLLLLAFTHGRRLLVQTLLLVRLRLRSVLVEKLEQLRGSVAVKSMGELGDGRRDFKAHVEDLALALEADVLGPFYHARKVALRLDVLADTEVAWVALDERILLPLVHFNGDVRIQGRIHLGLLLAHARLSGREWRRSGLLARLGRLSLRRTVSHCSISKSLREAIRPSTQLKPLYLHQQLRRVLWCVQGHCCCSL